MVSIGPTIQIKGEDQYRLATRKIIQETKELKSEMDLLATQFDKNESAMSKTTRMHELYGKQIESSKAQLNQLVEGLEKANKKHEDSKPALEAARQKVEELTKKQADLKAKLDEVEKATGKNSDEWKKANDAVTAATSELIVAEKELKAADEEFLRSGRVLADWQTTVNKAEIELNELNKEFQNTSLVKAWGNQFSDIGSKMAEFGEDLSKYVTAPLVALGGASIKAAADFEEGMAKIYTIAMDQAEPMEKMQKELIQLSNDTGFSLDDLTEATYQTVSASVDATEAVDFMTHAVKLARAGFTSTTRAVDILTTVMNSYGKETYDVEYLTDLLLKTQNDGKVIIDQLASSIGVIIPLAANYHVGIEQIAAAYATMTKQGVPAERATTFMRALFTELENQSKDVAEVLKNETGKSFAQLMDSGSSLADVLEILYNKMDKNSESYQQLFKNVRSGQAAASLAADGFSILRTELERMENVTGLTDRALEQLETPTLKAKRAVNQLKNATVDVGESLIEQFTPAFEKAVDAIRKGTDAYVGLSDETKNLITNTGLLVAAIGPGLAIGGKALELVGKLMLGTVPLSSIIGALAGGYLAVGAAAQVMTEAHNNEIKAEWGLNQELQTGIQTIQDLNTHRDELLLSTKEETDATLGQVAVAQELVTQYNSLVDKKGNIKKGNEELADVILNQLAGALGLEYDEVVKLIEENGKFGESVEKTIEKIKQRAEMAAYEKLYQDAIERKTQAEAILEKQETSLTDAVNKSKVAHENTTKAYNDMIKAQREGSPEIGYYEQKWRDAVQAESEAKNAEDTLRKAVTDTKDTIGQAAADVTVYGNKIVNAAKDTTDKVSQESEKGKKKVKGDSEEAGKAVKNNLTLDTSSLGYYMMTGLANGIAKYQYLAEQAAANAGRATSRSLNNSVQVKSPSRVTFATGKYFVEGFANAINQGISELEDMGYALGAAAANGLSVGSYMPETSGAVYNKQITAPISVNLTVNGNVDDPDKFVRDIGDKLADILTRNNEVFA